jgi:hypothetical protein
VHPVAFSLAPRLRPAPVSPPPRAARRIRSDPRAPDRERAAACDCRGSPTVPLAQQPTPGAQRRAPIVSRSNPRTPSTERHRFRYSTHLRRRPLRTSILPTVSVAPDCRLNPETHCHRSLSPAIERTSQRPNPPPALRAWESDRRAKRPQQTDGTGATAPTADRCSADSPRPNSAPLDLPTSIAPHLTAAPAAGRTRVAVESRDPLPHDTQPRDRARQRPKPQSALRASECHRRFPSRSDSARTMPPPRGHAPSRSLTCRLPDRPPPPPGRAFRSRATPERGLPSAPEPITEIRRSSVLLQVDSASQTTTNTPRSARREHLCFIRAPARPSQSRRGSHDLASCALPPTTEHIR